MSSAIACGSAVTLADQWVLLTPLDSCNSLYDMNRLSKVLSVSVPSEAAKVFDRIARQEGRTKSELFREMLRVYQAYRETRTFESLQRYGAAAARRRDITDERDVERLIRDARRV